MMNTTIIHKIDNKDSYVSFDSIKPSQIFKEIVNPNTKNESIFATRIKISKKRSISINGGNSETHNSFDTVLIVRDITIKALG